MKKLLLLVAVTAMATVSLKAQGTINFANSTTTKVTNSLTGAAVPLNSTAFVAGLYWGPQGAAESTLSLLGTTTTWSPFSGVYNGGELTVPGTPGGTRVQFQVRAWSSPYVSYAAALASQVNGVVAGKSGVVLVTLGGNGSPAAPAGSLVNLNAQFPGDTVFASGFNMSQVPVVPEPSTIALGLLGLGAIALFRRRK